MTFLDVLLYAVRNESFVREFNRLTESKLGQSLTRTQLEAMIDDACGAPGESEADMAKFVAFVYDVVWCRIPRASSPTSPVDPSPDGGK